MTLSLRNAALNGRHHRMIGEILDEQPTTGKRERAAVGGYTIVGGVLDDWKVGAVFDAENFEQTMRMYHFPLGIIVKRGTKYYRVVESTRRSGTQYCRLQEIKREDTK